MKQKNLTICTVLCAWIASAPVITNADDTELTWLTWSKQAFEKAKRENKFVLLDLEAVWCHWCHVMEEKTYRDPQVVALIREHYVPVRADQDAFPELSRRFEDYGWPATIFFDADGKVLLKRRGYIAANFMAGFLQGIRDDPEAAVGDYQERPVRPADAPGLTDVQIADVVDRYEWQYDEKHGGWGTIHKFVHADSLEYAMVLARRGNDKGAAMARETLDAAVQLLDPEWGGVYQYSDELDWKSPHYEKIMSIQTESIRSYALGYQLFHDPKYLAVAESVADYLLNFLMSPDGVFYTSQDADLNSEVDGRAFYALSKTDREGMGLPRIDENIYSRENGWVISALATLYGATGHERYLTVAQDAARWVIANYGIPGGGFRHGKNTPGDVVYLDDTLAMGRAFVDLYTVTGTREWLMLAQRMTDFISANFMDKNGGGFTTRRFGQSYDVLPETIKHLESNIEITRLANLIFHYTGNAEYRKVAEHGMRYLSSPAITDQRRFLAGVLLADLELRVPPVHMTIVGHKDSADAERLFKSAVGYPALYRRVEWWDKREGPMPNPDVTYPELDRAAAFACSNNACSQPIYDPLRIAEVVDKLYALTTHQ